MGTEIIMMKLNDKYRRAMLFLIVFSLSFIAGVIFLKQYVESGRSIGVLIPIPADEEKNVGVINKVKQIPLFKKEIYLTFDDGPTRKITPSILDILVKEKVRATFFVIGNLVERNEDIIKRMKDSGMSILPHSYSHKYSIYKSEKAYFEDLRQNIMAIENVVKESPPPYIRLPGGSSNKVGRTEVVEAIKRNLRNNNIRFVDWNVSSLDAEGNCVSINTIKDSVRTMCRRKNFAVLLMHDSSTKVTTVEALPDIIAFLKSEGFVFRTFNDITQTEEREMIRRKIMNK